MIRSVGLEPSTLQALGFEAAPLEDPHGPLPAGDGWILAAWDLPAETLQALVRAAATHAGRWTLLLVRDGRLVPISAGAPVPPGFVAERLEASPGVFSLRHAGEELARIRHDLNNPLTAALAETQLLRMDSDDEALAVIETQLGRLRDLIAELAQWRLPR
jgi:signal transduction histidine kinase